MRCWKVEQSRRKKAQRFFLLRSILMTFGAINFEQIPICKTEIKVNSSNMAISTFSPHNTPQVNTVLKFVLSQRVRRWCRSSKCCNFQNQNKIIPVPEVVFLELSNDEFLFTN